MEREGQEGRYEIEHDAVPSMELYRLAQALERNDSSLLGIIIMTQTGVGWLTTAQVEKSVLANRPVAEATIECFRTQADSLQSQLDLGIQLPLDGKVEGLGTEPPPLNKNRIM